MATAIWDFLYGQGFQPHGYCLMWEPGVFWTHVVADFLIAISYLSIPIAIVYLVRRRRDMAFGALPTLFALFIVACGFTHLFGVWTMWVPSYGPEAIVKALTAAVSVATAAVLWPLMPSLIAIPSVRELGDKNAELEDALRERERSERRLAEANALLETRVAERTQALEDALREAEAASDAKSDFLATISHEIRTPLNGVIGMLEVLAEDGLDQESVRRVGVARRSAGALLSLLNDVLDFSRLEQNALRLSPQPTAPGAVIADVIGLHGPAARTKGLSIDCAIDLPAEDATWLLDPLRLRQVLGNLVSNAVKFTEAGGVTIRLSVEPGAGSDILHFTVRDTGIGVAPDQRGKLFRRFSQADASTTRAYGGAGLGLAICRRVTELMGGEVTLVSSTPSGSVFRASIRAPRCGEGRRPDPQAAAETPSEEAPQPRRRAGPNRILVVDDDPVNREVFAAMLSGGPGRRSHLADFAESGREAVERAAGTRYDVILMDVSMPGMNGIEATRLIREGGASRDAPVVAVTAHAMAGDREAFLRRGMSGYLAKPVLPLQLQAAIDAAVGGGRW